MDNLRVDPCNICGSIDVNLIDGFYYCVECGTQDVNIRQTVIEDKALADGTFTIRRKNKLTVVLENKPQMSAEWHKWHAYNFILAGLADELIAVGAKPTFKMKVLWLWTEYIKKFQDKAELGLSTEDNTQNITTNLSGLEDDESNDNANKKKKKKSTSRLRKDITIIKKSLIVSFLYLGLNLDHSEIQLSDILRFEKEGRLNILECTKYVPKEIDVNAILDWKKFTWSKFFYYDFCLYPMPLLKCLDIPPIMPDLTKIVDKYMKELCMPKAFKELVLSLMHLCPPNYLEVDRYSLRNLIRLPLYECSIMAYVVIAFKMCFGLDDDYEIQLSDAVDKVNDENCYLKSYKFGEIPEPTDRLFSFREWCNYIELRKIILSKYYLYMADRYSLDIDDYVYMEQYHGLGKKPCTPLLTDEITMNMLQKIPLISNVQVIPKSEFKPTLTPLSTYTDLVLQYFDDPDLRLLFSEDFTQYSLEYACQKLKLEDGGVNVITGVRELNKTFNSQIYGTFRTKNLDLEMVYVRNCNNKNWLKTNQPTKDHIKKVNEVSSDKDSDHGYDSNSETSTSEIEASSKETSVAAERPDIDKNLEFIEEDKGDNIFDDDFADLIEEEAKEGIVVDFKEENNFEEPTDCNVPISFDDTQMDHHNDDEDRSQLSEDTDMIFNPHTFDREKTIRELILATCKKYKIKVPREYDTKEPQKRKIPLVEDQAGESRPKKREYDSTKKRPNRGEVKDEVAKLVAAYYENLQNDVFYQLSEQVKTVVNSAQISKDTENVGEVNAIESFLNDEVQDDDSTIVEEVRQFESHNNDQDINDNVDRTSASLICIDNSNIEDPHDKGDPKFNENEYDVKQLYVKTIENDDTDAFDIADDPEVAGLIDKKIEEWNQKKEKIIENASRVPFEKDDSDDELPLSVIKDGAKRRSDEDQYDLDPLLKGTRVNEFKYWYRNYAGLVLSRSNDMFEPFKNELRHCFPRSFAFVLKECASIIELSPYQLYKLTNNLENMMLLKC